jgi:hypothetical protein
MAADTSHVIFKVDCICDDLQQRRDVKTLERFIRMFANATAAQTTATGLENDCGNVVSFWTSGCNPLSQALILDNCVHHNIILQSGYVQYFHCFTF